MASPKANGFSAAANGFAKSSAKGRSRAYSARFNLAPHFIGGNHLEAAASGPVKDFVANHDGHTVITSVCAELPILEPRSNGVLI